MSQYKKIQVLLEIPQLKRLEQVAHQLRATKADLVREGITLVLQKKVSSQEDPLLGLIGQAGSSGRSNLSEKHDQYLLTAERRRWQRKGR